MLRIDRVLAMQSLYNIIESDQQPLLSKLVDDVAAFTKRPESSFSRITKIQHSLIELLSLLDPDYTRFPKERRLLIPERTEEKMSESILSTTIPNPGQDKTRKPGELEVDSAELLVVLSKKQGLSRA